ncbi:gamma-glutamylaminecyclotransferase-like [Daktulosphaira vitifoliae]|uniref:gamma-glutamylaminecyclotransferase-like n=1 Tax=Daktulosphaira vitifoliae TaxID=58002 RepID=UPI0021AA68D0|nr:gamma-glutamylaminecyclotransferase-like [Daktulosphaira vitifoliae]
MEKVFVYGTLKHNQPNFDAMKDEKNGIASFSTKATSIKMYPLVIGTKYNIPFLLCREGLGHEIRGEVYDVDANMLNFLDKFENHPNFYVRKKISVKLPNSSVTELKKLHHWKWNLRAIHNHNQNYNFLKVNTMNQSKDLLIKIQKATELFSH